MQNETLAGSIAEKIIELIHSERLEPGDKMPTEMKLAELFGVSRTTVREAEKLLRSRNVLEIRRGSGAFVSPKRGIVNDPLGFATEGDRIRLMQDLMALRVNLEPFMAELAAIRATRDDIRRLWEMQEEMEKFDDNDSPEFEAIDLNFHIQIANASHNLAARRIAPIVEEAFNALATSRLGQLSFEGTTRTHRAIVEAIEKRDCVSARNNMVVHLMLVEGSAEDGVYTRDYKRR